MDAEPGATSVVAFDRSASMIEAGRLRAQAGLTLDWRVAEVPPLPLARDSIDVALAVTVLCVATRPDALLAELARVVVPGGVIVIGELGECSVWALQRRVRGNVPAFGRPRGCGRRSSESASCSSEWSVACACRRASGSRG